MTASQAPAMQPTPDADPAADLAVWDLLRDVHRRVSRAIETELWRQHSLAPRQVAILRHVEAAAARRVGLPSIRDRLAVPTEEASRLCTVLEARGFLTRRRHGQQSVLTLTQQGLAITRRAKATQSACIREHLTARLSPEDLTALTALLVLANRP